MGRLHRDTFELLRFIFISEYYNVCLLTDLLHQIYCSPCSPSQCDMHAGILFPQTTASGTSGDHKGLGLFIEEWDYGVKDEQEGRGVWRDGDNGGFCEEAFNVTTLQKVDVSIGAFPAYAYIMQGSERFLDAIYGNWRSKLDKQAYEPGQGKPGSWSGADVVNVCQEVHRSVSGQGV